MSQSLKEGFKSFKVNKYELIVSTSDMKLVFLTYQIDIFGMVDNLKGCFR